MCEIDERERVLRHGTVIVWEFFTGGKTLNSFSTLLLLRLFVVLALVYLLLFTSYFVYNFNVGDEHTRHTVNTFRSSTILSSQFRSLFTVSTTIMNSRNKDSLNKHHLPFAFTFCFHFIAFCL